MEEKYSVIDMKNWKRAGHCAVFKDYVLPQFGVTVELDITHFSRIMKESGRPFTFAFIHAVTKCANEIEEFRYRFLNGNVVLYKQINAAFRSMNEETGLFKIVHVEMTDNADDFIKLAKETAENQKEYFPDMQGNDFFQFSALPWLPYVHIAPTYIGNNEKAAPMFNWGKFAKKDGKILLPFSVHVHHSFVDGMHISKLVANLQQYINEYK